MSTRLAELTVKLSAAISDVIPIYDIFIEECNKRLFDIIAEMHEWFFYAAEPEWTSVGSKARRMYIEIRKDIQMVAVNEYQLNISNRLTYIRDTCHLLIQQLKSLD